jgi:hypothetical protein
MQPQTNDQLPPSPNNTSQNDIFLEQTPAPEPASKKSIGLTVFLTITGICIFAAILYGALLGSADRLSRDYSMRANAVLSSSQKQLKYLEPSEALNKRDLSDPLQVISLDTTSQPQLPKVLFIGDMSKQYVKSRQMEVRIASHYKAINLYTENVQAMIGFDDAMQAVFVEEASLAATLKKDDAIQVRSFSGTELAYANRIKKTETAEQLRDTRAQLADLYEQKAALYTSWADALEKNDSAAMQAIQDGILNIEKALIERVTDQRFTKLMTPSYEKLVSEHKTLLSRAAP